jgi:hypothetical protein
MTVTTTLGDLRALGCRMARADLMFGLSNGGGFIQYGFRYYLGFTPFLVALMAIGSRR